MAPKELRIDGFRSLQLFIDQFEDKESALIKVLYEAQQIFGYLSREVMQFISEKLGVPVAKIYGVVSFYSYFTTEPKGRCQIKICTGTACFVRGAEKVVDQFERELSLKMGETSSDRKFSLDAVRCVGACGLAPVVMVNDKVYGKVDVDDVTQIIKDSES